jgi:hypothetical protein
MTLHYSIIVCKKERKSDKSKVGEYHLLIHLFKFEVIGGAEILIGKSFKVGF